METFLIIFIAYLIGSIPTSVWLTKWAFGVDIRNFGSGNAGATNTYRNFGALIALPVLIIDIMKGYFAGYLSEIFKMDIPINIESFGLILGMVAILGHIFPVFSNFRGGKGIATILGVLIYSMPLSALILVPIFLLILLTTQYVSLSSIIAGIYFPLSQFFLIESDNIQQNLFSVFICVLILITHRWNIVRLLQGEELKLLSKKINRK